MHNLDPADRAGVLFASAFLLQSDQNLLAPHLTAVATEFGMSDAERDEKLGGELAIAGVAYL